MFGLKIEVLKDVKYLIDNNLLDDKKKQKEMYDKSVALGYKDNGETYNKPNIQQFRKELDVLKMTGKIKSIYDGISETEKYAVIALYYD